MKRFKMDSKKWMRKIKNRKNKRCNLKQQTFLGIKTKEKSELLTSNKVY